MLYTASLATVFLSFIIPKEKDVLSLIASLIGVTALIFVAKGKVLGQALTILFAAFYGIVSWTQRYYGEMITYLCMSAPMALSAIISWLKNPYGNGEEVRVKRLSSKEWILLCACTILVTTVFYFLLNALNTANLIVSVFSVATSFFAASLTYLRSPYYALGYAANDLVLILLWLFSAIGNPSYLPMVLCFVMFLFNDLYGFFSWKRMERRQGAQ